jgi:DNA polymerase (family 10)
MASPNAFHIASLLKEFGRRTMLYGGNPHRAKAYLRAADSVAMLTEPIGELIARNGLREIPGVGDSRCNDDALRDRLPPLP